MCFDTIIGQIIGFGGYFFSLKAYFQKKKTSYTKNAIISSMLNVIHYLLLGTLAGALSKALLLLRKILLYKSIKSKKINLLYFIFIVILYILLGVFLYNNNILNLFPILAGLIHFSVEWFCSMKYIRLSGFITSILWIVYNIAVFSISGIIYNIITILFLIYVLFIKKDKVGDKNEKRKY